MQRTRTEQVFHDRRFARAADGEAGRTQDWEGVRLHQAPGRRGSEGPGDVGGRIGSRYEASLSATQLKRRLTLSCTELAFAGPVKRNVSWLLLSEPKNRMFMATLRLPTERINDWQSFHEVCQEVFGFPDFYGMNMDAWIDCMSYLHEDAGMTRFLLAEGEKMNIEIEAAEDFKARLPEVFSALDRCSSFVNERYARAGKTPVLSLILL